MSARLGSDTAASARRDAIACVLSWIDCDCHVFDQPRECSFKEHGTRAGKLHQEHVRRTCDEAIRLTDDHHA